MGSADSSPRWDLYRVLSEPVRLRLLALCAEEELTIGELADLLEEPQPKVSRHLKLLREGGLLSVRRQGTRTLVRLAGGVASDPVVADALHAGKMLVVADGSLARVPRTLQERDRAVRAFFDAHRGGEEPEAVPGELSAYLTAVAPLIERRQLAIDVGTGSGAFLFVLAPLFKRVLAVDRSANQLGVAEHRMRARGHKNVEFLRFDYVSQELRAFVESEGGADAVFASRLLHHASRPKEAMVALTHLCRPGGKVVILDYSAHQDERLREEQADLWLGFEKEELLRLGQDAALQSASVCPLPEGFQGNGPDRHLQWQLFVGTRPPRAMPRHAANERTGSDAAAGEPLLETETEQKGLSH